MSLLDALGEVAGFLESQHIHYAIIGGIAVQYWSESRSTRDIDVVVMVDEEKLGEFLDAATERFSLRIGDAVEFALRNRVLLIAASDGTPVDIALGIPGYEEEVLQRAVVVSLPGGHSVRMISAEDLIIHKCLAGRPRDVEDVERTLVRQQLAVDLDYIREWLTAFQPLVDDHDVLGLFEDCLTKARSELGEV